MRTATIQAQIEEDLQQKAARILQELHLTQEEFVQLAFLNLVALQDLPFNGPERLPNKETIEAIEELESGGGTRYRTVDEMFRDVLG